MNPSLSLSNPFVGLTLRAILGAYVIYMSRRFYADPTGYFRKAMRGMPDVPWVAPVIRALACFCLWGAVLLSPPLLPYRFSAFTETPWPSP